MIFETGGVELHYQTVGDGEPLLFVHGFMGTGADWRFIFPEPPHSHRLIAPDLRGHGASTCSSQTFSFRQCAADLRALLAHLQVDRTKAIGISGGGIALLHLASAAPSMVSSMVAVSAAPWFPEEARAIQRQWSQHSLGEPELAMMRQRHAGGERQLEQLFAWARGLADSYDDVNFTPPLLSTITAETLIVHGDRDPFYPAPLALELYRAIPRAWLWVVPNGGHTPVFGEAAPRFADTALAFLRGDWSAGPAARA